MLQDGNKERKQCLCARLQTQRGKDGIDTSKPGTTKYKTGRIFFFPLSLNTRPHTNRQRRPQGELIAEILERACCVWISCMCVLESECLRVNVMGTGDRKRRSRQAWRKNSQIQGKYEYPTHTKIEHTHTTKTSSRLSSLSVTSAVAVMGPSGPLIVRTHTHPQCIAVY